MSNPSFITHHPFKCELLGTKVFLHFGALIDQEDIFIPTYKGVTLKRDSELGSSDSNIIYIENANGDPVTKGVICLRIVTEDSYLEFSTQIWNELFQEKDSIKMTEYLKYSFSDQDRLAIFSDLAPAASLMLNPFFSPLENITSRVSSVQVIFKDLEGQSYIDDETLDLFNFLIEEEKEEGKEEKPKDPKDDGIFSISDLPTPPVPVIPSKFVKYIPICYINLEKTKKMEQIIDTDYFFNFPFFFRDTLKEDFIPVES